VTWRVELERGPASAFHARPIPDEVERTVRILEVDRPALVLGSTQPESDADRAALDEAGVELVRRRSGGGAVLLDPGRAVWVDIDLPAGDPLWSDDVARSFGWLGDAWVSALGGGVAHRGRLVSTPWSRQVCFAGLGPGEVTVDGRKVVGIAQRRTRNGARFQCAVLRRWDAAAVVALLDVPDRAIAAAELDSVAAGVDGDVAGALLRVLP
jgi:lipoate-protein ligase A